MAERLMIEFGSADAMLRALELLRQHRYRDLETYAPYPVPGVPGRLRLSGSALPILVFGGGLLGALLGYGIQWFADVQAYPLNVGGRPVHSVPAFIPATFEATILGAALAAFVGFLFLVRLPALWHPAFELDGFERASEDRFWVGVGGVRGQIEARRVRHVLAELAPIRVIGAEEEP